MDNIANLGMLNVEYGATVQLFFDFLGGLDFLPDLESNTWIKNEELHRNYFFYTRKIVSEEMEGGFMLTTQTLNCLLFFVRNKINIGSLDSFYFSCSANINIKISI